MLNGGITCDLCIAERSGTHYHTKPKGGPVPAHYFPSTAALNRHKNQCHGVKTSMARVSVSMQPDLLEWLDEAFDNRSEAINEAVRAYREARV